MERTHRTIRISRDARAEADRWGDAADDPEFREEAAELARAFEGGDIWPDAGLNVPLAEGGAA